MRESPVAARVRLEAARTGLQLWRNNVGACTDETGRLIRYGLANESAQQNKLIKSSDLIGITPVLVTPDMVGQILGVFTAFETKASGWHYSPSDERAVAQGNFINLVRSAGGFADFVTDASQIHSIVKRR